MALTLGLSTVDRLPARARPLLRPGDVGAGILHLGLGAFHRAHQAVYTEEAIAAGGGDWAIVGVAPRSRSVLDALRAQDLLFSVLSRDEHQLDARVVGAFGGLLHAAGDPLAVVARIADPAIRIVTLTVTEKAYGLDPATGRLREDPEVRADLSTDRPPRTVPGLLARGLAVRAATGAPLAVVSCDNLPANGRRVEGMVTAALQAAGDDAVLSWVHGAVRFPGTTVDRIVPASTADTYARAAELLGVTDRAAVIAEPFRQWVIEDDFPGGADGRPAWDKAGVVLTADTEPWERLKLRVLNGVHSALAYLGALAGCATIDEALRLPGMRAFAERLVDADIAPTLCPPPGESVHAYGQRVLSRFANPALGHRTLQVAMDGTQKLPQRLLGTIVDRRAAGAVPVHAALVLAAWMRFVRGGADDGRRLPLDDPLADRLRAAVRAAADTPAGLAAALLAVEAVFPPALAADPAFVAEVTAALTALARHGVRGIIRGLGSEEVG